MKRIDYILRNIQWGLEAIEYMQFRCECEPEVGAAPCPACAISRGMHEGEQCAKFIKRWLKKENSKETYDMEYTCSNCGTTFIHALAKGEKAKENGGQCPYCGYEDSWIRPFKYKKPL